MALAERTATLIVGHEELGAFAELKTVSAGTMRGFDQCAVRPPHPTWRPEPDDRKRLRGKVCFGTVPILVDAEESGFEQMKRPGTGRFPRQP